MEERGVSTRDAAGYYFHLKRTVSTPAVYLLPVSMTPVANNWNNIRQLTPESELEEKIYLYVNSTTQRCKNILKMF